MHFPIIVMLVGLLAVRLLILASAARGREVSGLKRPPFAQFHTGG
jgi:hypothetical protein